MDNRTFPDFILFFSQAIMKSILTQKEIGSRIAILRKRRDLTQEELAKRLGISRPALTQMELGNRGIDIMEMQKLAMVLEFSLDEFMSRGFRVEHELIDKTKVKTPKQEIRISFPTLDVEKFKNVLLYILEQCAGRPNVGETVLKRLLYFSDFNHYEIYEEHLTTAKYRKLPYGPVPEGLDVIINQLIDEGQLLCVNTEFHGYPLTRYLPLLKPDLTLLKASEVGVIDKVIQHMGDWSQAMITQYAHGDKPWRITEDNEELNYELAFYRGVPYTVRVYEEDEE